MDKVIVFFLIIVAVVGIYLGLTTGGQSLGLLGDSSPLFASASAMVETDWTESVGEFLISFDNFKNFHRAILEPNLSIKVFDMDGVFPGNLIYAATDRGLFLSRDGGLTWDHFISSNNEINSGSIVFRVIPASASGEDYFISVFKDNRGVVYRTYDYFFHLEKLMDFDDEAAYDLYRSGNYLYLAISNGQLIRFNLETKEAKVVNAFSSPVVKIYRSINGYFFLLFKSGTVARSADLEGEFKKINLPGGTLFSSPGAKRLDLDQVGNLYLLNRDGLFVSHDDGKSFVPFKHLPVQEKKLDAFAAYGRKIYVVVKNKIYTSSDGGENWKIDDLPNQFQVSSFYFAGERVILSR
ncbi:MAG: hypothetical protein UV58_C0001G0023 [Candidatus Wolfebacteria bacterium GW2011_GWC1_43_10]|uniref:Photosynthesis system II assembly factor Ycf48/Hcf136-like domain-containing protein n=2 Tax=Candidatus Wolfeibacteriota TaxID=1752735 RepID=A0A0G1EJ98_9BACT|nr:MAG: hypothetical protein UV58_C0001G0023 [Candidatus Wolfebacteria bacterium GW2011_GWC1_43_10]KKT22722.1 MAG: hypothetical protein UW08_C0004G0018 [Parcubacteria group bacterium GW2011_GWB1_43_8b]OGM90057.1 MAG: hypothetical protein A2108_01825 [Candidatus Wolfebacteria bacterium GWA1_42_9]